VFVVAACAGATVIDADQAGNADYAAAAEVSQSISVGRLAQVITFTSTPPAHAAVGERYQLAASGGGSGNPVTFTVDPATTSGACTVSASGLVRFTGPGTCIIDADQAGNSDFGAAPLASQTISVTAATSPSSSSHTAGTPLVQAQGGLLAFTGIRAFDLILTTTVVLLLGAALLLIAGHRRQRATPAEENRPER
jgi:hypothetical protein